MKALDVMSIINDVAASQRGLFTSAQATSLGVDRMALSRLAKYGQIEPVARGVYKAAAAPSIREEDVYAAWLAAEPSVFAYLRPMNSSGCVVSLGTAAWLHGLGELNPEPITFSCPRRKQSRNGSVRFLRRSLSDGDVCVVSGIPATTQRRTVLDLIDYGEDLSLIASVLRDAEDGDPALEIADEVNLRAKRRGFDKGFNLYALLKRSDL